MVFQEEKISVYQAFLLVLASGAGLFIVVAEYSSEYAANDGWLTLILAFLIGMAFSFMLADLNNKFPGLTVIEYLPQMFGSFWGKLGGVLYLLYYLVYAALVLRGTSEQVRPLLMETPLYVIVALGSILTIYTLKLGFEVFARVLELLIPVSIILFLLSFICIAKDVDFNTVKPVLAEGLGPVIKNVPFALVFPLQAVMFMVIWLPCLNRPAKSLKVGLAGMAVAGALMITIFIFVISFASMGMTKIFTNSIYQLFQYIVVARYLLGFEFVFMILWIITAYYMNTSTAYLVVISFAKWLKLKDYKTLIYVLMSIVFALSLMPRNVLENRKMFILWGLVATIPLNVLLVLGWVIVRVRLKRRKKATQ